MSSYFHSNLSSSSNSSPNHFTPYQEPPYSDRRNHILWQRQLRRQEDRIRPNRSQRGVQLQPGVQPPSYSAVYTTPLQVLHRYDPYVERQMAKFEEVVN